MKSSLFTVVFGLVLGLVCALVLTATAEFIKPRREANELAERYRNILEIFDIPLAEGAANQDIIRAFEDKVTIVGSDSANPDYYRYAQFIAIPAQGPGLWGPIEGLIGLAPDGVTITAVSFYKQEETPGLGGEIAGKNFTDRFIGKKLFDAAGRPALKIVRPGKASGDYQVDAISGATMTSDKVQALITAAAEKFKSTESN
ncbi:MAG: FMN-binding protein [Actinobacteria bacterium]|nr:FMN-binding protein [Actinomycetota bacterium]